MTHDECVAAIAARRAGVDRVVKTEYRLPDGHVADVIGIGLGERITIWEVKSRWRSSELMEAWAKYSPFVDYLWFVSLALADADWASFTSRSGWPDIAAPAGVMSYLGGHPRIYRAASGYVGSWKSKQEIAHNLLCV